MSYAEALAFVGDERANPPASRRPQEPRQRPIAPNPSEVADNAKMLASAARYVREMRPIRGTPAEEYLRNDRERGGRGIDTDAIADVLSRTDAIGWHPAVMFRQDGHELDGQRIGAIIAVMTDPKTAKPTGAISRTYIVNGRKLTKAKTLGQPQGLIRLSWDDDVTHGLFIAEGLETALDAMSLGLRPIWATGSTSIMAAFPPLAGIECLTVLADNDPNGAGEKAARAVESAWLAAGAEVRIFMAAERGDLNDMTRKA